VSLDDQQVSDLRGAEKVGPVLRLAKAQTRWHRRIIARLEMTPPRLTT